MKYLLILALAVSAGCVIKKTDGEEKQGQELKRFEPLVVGPEDTSRIKAICAALESKEERLPVLISSNYTFALSEKGCKDEKLGEERDVKVRLERPESRYVFQNTGGESFPFSNVETTEHGSMAEICKNLQDLRSPIQTSSKGALWFTTFTSTKYCSSDYNSMCIHIQRGEHVSDVRYNIHTNEWIKFRIRDEKVGFFVERRQSTLGDCGPGESIERRVRLK